MTLMVLFNASEELWLRANYLLDSHLHGNDDKGLTAKTLFLEGEPLVVVVGLWLDAWRVSNRVY